MAAQHSILLAVIALAALCQVQAQGGWQTGRGRALLSVCNDRLCSISSCFAVCNLVPLCALRLTVFCPVCFHSAPSASIPCLCSHLLREGWLVSCFVLNPAYSSCEIAAFSVLTLLALHGHAAMSSIPHVTSFDMAASSTLMLLALHGHTYTAISSCLTMSVSLPSCAGQSTTVHAAMVTLTRMLAQDGTLQLCQIPMVTTVAAVGECLLSVGPSCNTSACAPALPHLQRPLSQCNSCISSYKGSSSMTAL